MTLPAAEALSPPTDSDWVDLLVAELGTALAADFGRAAFPVPAGWELQTVRPRTFWKRVPVVELTHGSETLCFIVTPTEASEPAFRRTARHDVIYFSEDVPDEAQDRIFRRDREMIEAFARWLSHRDGPAPGT
jgi:hypothetical protein